TECENSPGNGVGHVARKISAERKCQCRANREIVRDLDVHEKKQSDPTQRIKRGGSMAFVIFLFRFAEPARAEKETDRGNAVGVKIPIPNRSMRSGMVIQH